MPKQAMCRMARFALEQGMDQRKLHKMDDEEVIAYLSQIKGVGRWTVEMLMMFALGRENVFALDDLRHSECHDSPVQTRPHR